MEFLNESILPHLNYWVYVILMMIGLYAMISKNNLIKKLIGMSIFQTAIILFFVSLSVKSGAGVPIIHYAHGRDHHAPPAEQAPDPEHPAPDAPHSDAVRPEDYANPLPHVLMLTAIVVGVATLGVGLAVTQRVFKDFDTIEENEILARIGSSHD